MSLISRLFRKPLPPSAATGRPPEPATALPKQPSVPDQAAVTAQEDEALATAIAAGDSVTIGRLVAEGTTTSVRQRAAQAVEDLLQLRELIRRVRGGNDKSVYRILTAKRDAILAQLRESERLRAEIGAAADAIERHSHRPYDALFAPTLEQFEKRWQGLAGNAGPELSQQVLQALERSREVIRQHREALETQAARERAAARAAGEAARQRELEYEAAAAAAAEQARLQGEERRVQIEKEQAEALALRTLAGLLRKAQAALDDGNTARAARLRGQLEAQMAAAPPLPAWLARQLQQLDAKLNDLKDWKAFSVAPKRDELMGEIESLVGSTLEPVALARWIRDVQQQWRTLGKGAGENLTAEWQQRFTDAANRAYEPCHVFFAAQAEERRANLERRTTLVERLAAFSANQAEQGADWRLVIQVLREARREWRRYSPVDRAAAAPVQERFDALWAALQASIEAEYTRNAEAKRTLIERAAALLAVADTGKAIDEIRQLQRRWKVVGLVPREQDEPLWEAFREHCDAVFQRREQESAAYVAGLEANRAKAIALCEELDRIAALCGQELLSNARQLEELRGAFEALDLPRQGARELQQRFDRAVERCQAAVAGQHARDAQRIWTDLLEVANRVRAVALGVVRNADEAEREALRGQAEAAIAVVSQWPKGARAAIERQLGKAKAGAVDADVAADEAALRALCVRAEVLANVQSPPEDQPLRQTEQLRRLVQSMGQGVQTDAAQLGALMTEWLAIGPTEEATYAQLMARFGRCFVSLTAHSGK